MNPHDSADAQLADAAFAAAMREEPALHLDLAAIERRGAARLHRRRTLAVSRRASPGYFPGTPSQPRLK